MAYHWNNLLHQRLYNKSREHLQGLHHYRIMHEDTPYPWTPVYTT